MRGGIVERLCRLAFSFSFYGLVVVVQIDLAYEIPHKLYPLPAVAAGLVWGVDDNLLYEFIDDGR